MSSRPIISLRIQKHIKDALARTGYDTVQDVLSASPTSLARELNITVPGLNITVPEVDDLIQQIQNPHTQNSHVPLTQSAAVIMKSARTFSTHWEPLDELLEGGLVQGHILELSGPPGSPKENIAIDIVSSFLDAGEEVLFVDCQNMTSLETIRRRLSGLSVSFLALHYIRISTAAEVMVFLHSLDLILDSKPKAALLVLNSFSFPFSTVPSPHLKSRMLEQIKQILIKVTAVRNLTVLVTCQMANKMLKDDGSAGSFDEGGKGMMVPQLGSSYLPSGRSHRVILSFDGPTSGAMFLLPSSPQMAKTERVRHVPYVLQ
ncbi:hypothetical protein Agabi119p4_8452 [Agaricus bisporus var. burnettii]|uniref:RecA family profile 1 domain-containing protein n=1 Tax=Agaricus bisporus var. burnettii TaxID=192524 RepID=A0A8H7C755_AGABI|nr:hypothetical protein Agabi119p4_8452 [Agaricus bisporus var. burnettii]